MYQEGRGKKIVIGKQRFRPPPHPWEAIDLGWYKGNFGPNFKSGGAWCVVLNPGFINGIDPIIKGAVGYNQSALNNAKSLAIGSTRAGLGGARKEVYTYNQELPFVFDPEPSKRQSVPLLKGAIMALDFSMARTYPDDQGKITPLKIQNMGVPAKAASDNLSINGEKIVMDVTNENAPTNTRIAKALDIVIGMARPGLSQQISFSGDLGIMSGRLVSYNWGYDTTAIDALGWRPFIYQVTDFDTLLLAEKTPSIMDIIENTPPPDDQLDKLHLARVWAVSPPNPSSDKVDDTWNLVFEYRCFWNLCYELKIPKIYATYPPIRYYSGLAFGLGDALINSYLALQDEITQRVFNGVMNSNSPKGRFWNI